MKDTSITVYNEEKLYEEKLLPLITEIKKICVLSKIPCFTCVATANSSKGTTYKYDGVLTGTLNVNLSDDRFAKHLCVANGFDVHAPGSEAGELSDFLEQVPQPEATLVEEPTK